MAKQAKAKLNELRMAPRKVRLVADLIRDMDVDEAKTQLRLSKKRAAKPMLKLLNSAIANAEHNQNLDKSTLTVKIATVDEGPTMKRYQPRAYGRATTIRKRSSHIKLVLEGEEQLSSATSQQQESEATGAEESEEEQIAEEESRKKLMRKTKDEIKEYAEEEYGIELSTNDLKKEMIDQFFEKLN
ncbi:MAG: 50S ribosomal protein L22 [Candidatus Magasanikbacteria bacterium]